MIRFQSSVTDHNSNVIVTVAQMLDLIHDNHSMSQTESVTILSCPGLQWGLKKAKEAPPNLERTLSHRLKFQSDQICTIITDCTVAAT